tara:strand:- start:183 stop:950 length:768 start_codon:yes stop_codon:yes gene_type:complete
MIKSYLNLILVFILFSISAKGGSGGYLGVKNNIVLHTEDFVTNRIFYGEYQRIFNRGFGFAGGLILANGDYRVLEEDAFNYSYIAKKGDLHFSGFEVLLGVVHHHLSINSILPVGFTGTLQYGLGAYSFHYDSRIDEKFDNKKSFFCFSFQYSSRKTFNVYKNINVYVGATVGYTSAWNKETFESSTDDSDEDYYYEDEYEFDEYGNWVAVESEEKIESPYKTSAFQRGFLKGYSLAKRGASYYIKPIYGITYMF